MNPRDASAPPPGYVHSQRGPWGAVLGAFALALLCGVMLSPREPVVLILLPALALVFAILALAFDRLTVADDGDGLRIAFGPLPLFHVRIPYAEIRAVERDRTTLLDSWGIHMSPRGGWVWNIWGRDCVLVRRDRGPLRIGTDDAAQLLAFLKARAGTA